MLDGIHKHKIINILTLIFLQVRVFSAFIKDIEDMPPPSPWGMKMSLGQLLAEFPNSSGGGKRCCHCFKKL
jgi:actin related protein 2/3 complex subunit 1A/1B